MQENAFEIVVWEMLAILFGVYVCCYSQLEHV